MKIFKKLNLSGLREKLQMFQKSDKDVNCAQCGVRTGLITRQWLFDDKCLCANCQNKLPISYKKNYNTMSIEKYTRLLSYMSLECKELKNVFKNKHSIAELSLDTANGILRYHPLSSVPLYIKLKDIQNFSLRYHSASVNEERGYLYMTLESRDLYINIHEDLESKALEDDCDKFMAEYFEARLIHVGYETFEDNRYQETKSDSGHGADELALQNALGTFLFKNLEDVTMEKLKSQRNRLIKDFHPDHGTESDKEFAQMINEAYELLRNYIKQKG